MKWVQSNVVRSSIWGSVAVQIKCGKGKDQKDVVICTAYFPLDSAEKPHPTVFVAFSEKRDQVAYMELRASVIICEKFRVKWDFSGLPSSKT